MINRLPAGSELQTERAGIDRVDRSWTQADYLLAIVVDQLAIANYQFAAANSKHRPSQKPKPIPRPRDQAAKDQRRRERKPGYWPGKTIVVPREG